MNEEQNKKLADIEKRMDTMEAYHPDISFTTKALTHGIVSNWQFLGLVALFSGVTAYLVVKYSK